MEPKKISTRTIVIVNVIVIILGAWGLMASKEAGAFFALPLLSFLIFLNLLLLFFRNW
jgi:hypothetical protein